MGYSWITIGIYSVLTVVETIARVLYSGCNIPLMEICLWP